MIDEIQRRYRILFDGQPEHGELEARRADVHAWLERLVFPFLEEMSQRFAFQEAAIHSLRSLTPDAQTTERRLLNAVRQAQVKVAEALVDASTDSDCLTVFRQHVSGQHWPDASNPSRSEEAVLLEAAADAEFGAKIDFDQIVDACSGELFSRADFFGVDRSRMHSGFGVPLRPCGVEISAIAPGIVRSVLIELDRRDQYLAGAYQPLIEHAGQAEKSPNEALGRVVRAVAKFHDAVRKFAREVRSATYATRENACLHSLKLFIGLCQPGGLWTVDSAIDLPDRLRWLPIEEPELEHGSKLCLHRLDTRSAELFDHFVRVAPELGTLPSDSDSFRELQQSYLLVLDPAKQRISLDVVESTLPRASFELLLELARRSLRAGAPAAVGPKEMADVVGKDFSPSKMSSRKNELVNSIPALKPLISPGGTKGSYVLKLHRDDVRILGE